MSLRSRLYTSLALAAGLAATVATAHAAALDAPSSSRQVHSQGYHWNGGNTQDFEYALIDPLEDTMTSSSMRNLDDLRHLSRTEDGPVWWFVLDGKQYLVRDSEWVAKANEAVAPMKELGKKQAKLGSKQSALGSRQSTIGGEQSKLGSRMGQIARKITSASMRESHGEDSGIDRQRLQSEMNELQARMNELQIKQQPLADQQRDLGEQQRELGERQREAANAATHELEKLAREAVKAGKTIPAAE